MNTATRKFYDIAIFWASGLAYGCAFLFLCATYFPHSVLHFKYADRHLISGIYPVRWDFYTGNSRAPIYQLYQVSGGKAILKDPRPFSSAYLFGLKRYGKIIFSETEGIVADTTFIAGANKYTIQTPFNADINNYIRPDTLRYNTYRSENVIYLKGNVLLTIEEAPSWLEQRTMPGKKRTITLIPINLASGT